MRYEIVSYRPEFRDQATELQRHLLGVDADTSVAHFAWKFEQNPYVSRPLIYLALSGNKVVGLRAFYGASWQAEPAEPVWICPCAGGIMVDAAHRDRGLYQSLNGHALRDLAAQGYRFVFNFSPSPPNHLGSLKLGWQLVAPYQTLTRETRRNRFLRWTDERIRQLPLAWRYANEFLSVVSKPNFDVLDRAAAGALNGGPLVISKDPWPEAMAELAQRTGSGSRLRHVRGPEYFTWRFKSPLHDYRFLFWQDQTLDGYLVLETPRASPTAPVNIVDWQARDPAVMDQLIEATVRLGEFERLSIWSATLTSERNHQLRSLGFRATDETRGFSGYRPGPLVKAIGPDQHKDTWELAGQAVLEIENWDLRMIFSDYF